MPEREVTPDTLVWNVEPQGHYNPWFISKFHLARPGDCLAVCSTRIILNVGIPDRGVGFGGPQSFGDGRARLSTLDRDDVCRRCVPVMP